MQITSNGYDNANINALQNANINPNETKGDKSANSEQKQFSVEEEINRSAIKVSISMGAQIILQMMESKQTVKDNSSAQKDILDFLSGKKVSEDFNLANTGYQGKPITELSKEEATQLVGDDGFFGVEKTAQRVSGFVLSFSGDSLEKLEAGRKGIVQGFEDAQKMWGGELPEISHKTQAKTLELIDKRIAELKGEPTPKEDNSNTKRTTQVDITA